MTPIDQKLYYIFSRKDVKTLPGEMMQEPPQLHDVFRLAEGKEWNNGIIWWNDEIILYPFFGDVRDNKYGDGKARIPYNPTIPLLSQSDDTKSALISLFK